MRLPPLDSQPDASYAVTYWLLKSEYIAVIRRGEEITVPAAHWLQSEVDRWAENENRWEAWIQESPRPVQLPDGTTALPGTAIAMFSWEKYRKGV